ncbi:GTP-binding protein hflX [Vibrio sp. JCM 19236]|nr:GTP-binding protein hflX [Vibrio sp. JCM 19236]
MKSIRQEEYDTEGNLLIDIRMQQADWARLQKREEVGLDDFIVV